MLVALTILFPLIFATSGCQQSKATPGQDLEPHANQRLWADAASDAQSSRRYADEMPELSAVPLEEGSKLRVVATTSIVADVVQQVGGVQIELATLLPLGTDPHTFEPTPQDAVAVADAHVVFINGAGLEVFLERLLESTGKTATVVPVSYGLEYLQFAGAPQHTEESEEDESRDHADGTVDPHTWFDPYNVIAWAHNIERALSALDPANADAYKETAQAYEDQLEELDVWIREQLTQVTDADRKLVTDHMTFSYLAHRYGFEQVGAVFPGYSTLDAPSAKDVAALEDAIRELGVKALFVATTVNPELAERIAEDTGTELVYLYSGSLSEPGGPADSYLALMRYNVSAIVETLGN
jgi:manganese/iron transport system substrate-binding protein